MQTRKKSLIDRNSCKEVPLQAWKMNEHVQTCKQTCRRAQALPKWHKGNRQGGKYVLKGEGKTFVGWGTHFILLNQFVRFFSEPRCRKSRAFPCKLPSLISLSDTLDCATTHQRPSVRWAKGSKPEWEQSLCTLEHRGLPHSLSCQTEGRKRRNTSRKISTGSVIYRDLCRAPRLPHYESRSMISFFLFIFPPRVSFHVAPAPAHPQLHPTALPPPPPLLLLLLPRPCAHISKNSCLPTILTSGNEIPIPPYVPNSVHLKDFVKCVYERFIAPKIGFLFSS